MQIGSVLKTLVLKNVIAVNEQLAGCRDASSLLSNVDVRAQHELLMRKWYYVRGKCMQTVQVQLKERKRLNNTSTRI